MKILAVSDVELESIYNPNIAQCYGDVDLVIGCGDLSYYYLEYIISSLDVPLYFVRGNHNHLLEYSVAGTRTYPWGAVDLHRRSCRDDSGLLLAGIEGSLRYREGPYQYSEPEMWLFVLELAVSLMGNRLIYGRFLDVLV
ncbi:MAG: hypothetical protein U1B80_03870, partial [Anaerolineaceae bacterium]|nr:hypothetical protein [Anaerolineaceae bacterium]